MRPSQPRTRNRWSPLARASSRRSHCACSPTRLLHYRFLTGTAGAEGGTMSQAKLQSFLADVAAIKSGSHFWSPNINIDGRHAHWHTSIKGLIDWLRNHFVAAQPITLAEAVGQCGNPNDDGLVKYMPAILRLV